MKRSAILLVRVSTIEQDYNAQIYDLTKYGESLGYTQFKIIETKETAFADLSEKVGTNAMFKFIQENPEYSCIMTTEISRIGRRQSILHQIKEHCLAKQIQIYIKDLSFKLLDDDGKISQISEMTFTLYGMIAESEIKQKKERFIRSRKDLMQQGLSISGKLLFGYDRLRLDNKKNTLVINKEQSEIVKTIFNWYLNGLNTTNNPLILNPSIKTISLECIKRGFHPYTHSKRNVNKLLKEEGYTGLKTTNNKRKNPKFGIVTNEDEYLISNTLIKYPTIIDKETFDKVHLKLKSNVINSDKETKHITLLSKILTCPSCGRKLSGNYRTTPTGNKNSYRCTSRGDTTPCTSKKSLPMNLVDSAVWSLIKKDLPALSTKINEINPDEYLVEMNHQLNNLVAREKEIQERINENVAILNSVGKLTSGSVLTLIESTGKKIKKLEGDLNKIEQEKTRIESNKLLISDKQTNIESVINDNLDKIESSKELLKKYINIFVDEINIIEHSVKYTILKVTIKNYFKDYTSLIKLDNQPTIPMYKDYKYLILDKTVTRNIKGAYYVNKPVYPYYPPPKITLEDDLLTVKNEIISKEYVVGEPLNYIKLNLEM
ncbi:recombinase family protein [Flavobacterium sp. Sr18]|uniref:recombinase family protein n=1 Tax=Flavobacterium sp. Sr18 TaxID=935222 RepID=UPI0013E4B778|nr:recombinase family protein [Flavobacterium sp. Sr18]QIH37895.1 recombinase family protein [Flavobacterium sp. Sr18]